MTDQHVTRESPPWTDERRARAALSFICEAGRPGFALTVAQQGATAVWQSLRASPHDGAWPRRARRLDLDQLLTVAHRCGARFIIPGDVEWPERLGTLDRIEPLNGMAGAPIGLWVIGPAHLGELCESRLPAVAIVGSRAASRYGQDVAADLAMRLAPEFPVISGGAFGIDAAAHRGALAAAGQTIAVLAGGLDDWYPRGNGHMLEQIARECLVISEIAPGIRPTRQGFLARNRLIAALAGGTVVVEAASRSGALNTASWTTRLSSPLMAVPGPITSALSESPHRMIRDHEASLVGSAADVRALLTPIGEHVDLHGPKIVRMLDGLDPRLAQIREAMPARGDIDLDSLSVAAGRPPTECIAALTQLELLDLVKRSGSGRWTITRGRER